MKTFLFSHRGALGDFVLAWPALARLRARYPEHRFLGLGRPEHLDLAIALGLADAGLNAESAALLPFYSGAALPPDLEGIDAALLWTAEDPALRALLAAVPGPVVFHPPFPAPRVHVADHHLAALEAFGIPSKPPSFPLFSLPSDPASSPGHFVLVHPGSGSPAKNFSPDFYRRVAALRDAGRSDVRFLIGPAERSLKPFFAGEFPIEEPESVLDLAHLLSRAAVFVGNDSGPSHLAAALGVPAVALHRSTDPEVWGVRGRAAFSLHAADEAGALAGVRKALRTLHF